MIKLNYHSSQKRLTDINKKELSNNKEDIILNERLIMIEMKHPFIVKLEYAFQTVLLI